MGNRVDRWAELHSARDGSVRLFAHICYETTDLVFFDMTASIIDGKAYPPSALLTSSKVLKSDVLTDGLTLADVQGALSEVVGGAT